VQLGSDFFQPCRKGNSTYLLGHADPGTTKSLYAKSLKGAEKAASNLMESIITGNLDEIGTARE